MGGVDAIVVAADFLVPSLRHIHNGVYPADMVEEKQIQDHPHGNELDRCYCICPRAGVLRIRLRGAELPDSLQLAGENAAHRRLSVGEQDGLRPACADDSRTLPAGTQQTPGHEELSRQPIKPVPPPQRAAQCGRRRYRGVQLPCRRHRDEPLRRLQSRILRHAGGTLRAPCSRSQSRRVR